MKIEIEGHEDYRQCDLVLGWLAARMQRYLRAKAAGLDDEEVPRYTQKLVTELAQALDDYRQTHWPLGGEPK